MTPDLIEAATDWDNALAVADRYTGIGSGGVHGGYFLQQGKCVLAAALLIANKRGKGYGWIRHHLADQDVADLIDGECQGYETAVQYLHSVTMTPDRERSGCFSTAYVLLSKALQPQSLLDPDLFN
jgi:hypothetical protein